jgi:sirohydrochlorin cobaltochelatase
LNSNSAYLLVAHGSRDPNYHKSLQQLADLVGQQLLESQRDRIITFLAPSKDALSTKGGQLLAEAATISERTAEAPPVATACLELQPLSLQEQIENIALDCIAKGFERLRIFPLFLAAGVHLREDLPREVRLAEANSNGEIKLELLPHLGCHPNLYGLLQAQFDRFDCSHRLLLAHGSRRQSAQNSIESIASRLDASAAYTSIAPSLTERVTILVKAGATSIAIVPYFIFAGRISDAIALEVKELQIAFPQVRLQLGEPLGATKALARTIVTEI